MSVKRIRGVVRDCTHPIARHQHGTATAYKLDLCGCTPCRVAITNAERRRRLNLHIGAAPTRIDATEVLEHVRALGAQGLGYKRVAQLAGVAPSTVAKIINRDPSRADGRPQKRVRPDIAEKILGVRASLDTVTDGASIDATGTRRRLQALHARGWSRRALAVRLGMEHNALRLAFTNGTVSGRLARAVRDLYEELWDQAPPATTGHERASITRTLRWAAANRWAVPAAWDDDQLDDPAARPRGLRADAWEVAA